MKRKISLVMTIIMLLSFTSTSMAKPVTDFLSTDDILSIKCKIM